MCVCLVWSTLLKLSTFFILLTATSLFTQKVWSRHVSTVCLVCVNFGGYEFISFFVWQWTKFGVFFFFRNCWVVSVFVSLSVLEISPKRIFFFKFDTFPPQVRKSDRATCSCIYEMCFCYIFVCVCLIVYFFPFEMACVVQSDTLTGWFPYGVDRWPPPLLLRRENVTTIEKMFVLVSLLNLLSYLEIFSLESFISTNMAYTHITSFFSALPTTTRPFFSFDNGHSRGALHVPAIWGRPWFSSLVCFKHPAEVLFFRRMGDPFFFMKYDHLSFTPSRKIIIFNFKSRTPVRSSSLVEVLIILFFDSVSVSYRSVNQLGNGPHGRCLFIGIVSDVSVWGKWGVASCEVEKHRHTHTKMISTACFWLLPLWPTGVK